MSTTPQNDATGTKNDANGTTDEPKVIIDPSIAGDAGAQAGSDAKVEKTEAMPQPPVAAASDASATVVDAAAGTTGAATAPVAPPPSADNGADAGKDEEDKLPTNDGRMLKYGLGAAAVLLTLALFGVGYLAVRNSTGPATQVTVPASAPAPQSGPLPLPEVRTPAPRLIDATGCRRGQYRVEGNQLVFTNCATVELAEPNGR